jgi:6-phosphogluconolactonase
MAYESLFARAPIPSRNILRVPTEIPDPTLVAETYETTIATKFELRRRRWPRFDLVLLGLGADGHTASLFPGTPALEERERIVTATYVEALKSARVTLTYPVFNAAAFVMFLVSGAEKAEALKATLEGESALEPTPARRIKPITGRVVWMVDEAAASMLSA